MRAFAGKHGMGEDMLPGLLQQLTSGLVDGGHLPTVQLPVKVGDNPLMLQVSERIQNMPHHNSSAFFSNGKRRRNAV